MLIRLIDNIKQDKIKVISTIISFILLSILARLYASFSAVSQPIIKFLRAPFQWVNDIAPIKTQVFTPNAFAEWVYILGTFILLLSLLYGAYRYLFGDRTPQMALLCEDQIVKITKTLESNPNALNIDAVIDLLKTFELGISKIFPVKDDRNRLCVWVYPDTIAPGATSTNKWLAFCTDKTNPEKYLEIIETGILKRADHKHFLTDLKSYKTDAVEFAFVKNIGEFKFGIAILLMESNKVTEKTQKEFTVSTSLIHHIAQLDKNIMTVV